MLICTIYSAFAFGFFLADEIFDIDNWERIGIFNVLAFLVLINTIAGNGVVPEKPDNQCRWVT